MNSRTINKNSSLMPTNIGNYLFSKRGLFTKYIAALSIFTSSYFFFKSETVKRKLLFDPLDDILNSREVKGEGILLIEELFKDRRTKQNVLVALKGVITEKKFEDEFKVFIKTWFFKVIKHPDFLTQTKFSVIEVFKSPPVISETATLLKFISDQERSKECVSRFMKGIFLSDEVFQKMCTLFENTCLKSLQCSRTRSHFNTLCGNLMNDKEFKAIMYAKIIDVYSAKEPLKESTASYAEVNIGNK